MKKYIHLFVLFASACMMFAQQASTYFPAQAGYKWYFRNTPLDTNNQPVDSLVYYGIDSSAGSRTYLGVQSKYILSKTGQKPSIFYLPYIDTTDLNFSGTDAQEYFKIPGLDSIMAVLHRTGLDTAFGTFNFPNTLKSFQKWYTLYKFNNTVNSQYTIFQYDTTVTYNSTSLPLRFLLKGKRLADANLTTEIGTFTTKPFLFEFSMNLLIVVPPFPAVAVPFITIPDSIYFAPDKWLVRRVLPSTTFDLSRLGMPIYSIPGLKVEVIPSIPVSVKEAHNILPSDMTLQQNYPNPFNPSTTIVFTMAKPGNITLRLYDVLGREAALLTAGYYGAGEHKVILDGSNLAAGVYYYRLETAGSVSVKKLTLIK